MALQAGATSASYHDPGGTVLALFTGLTTRSEGTDIMNIKDIAATLAILGSGVLATGCGKEAPATEVPGGDEAAPTAGAEAKCAADHSGEGHCADEAAPADADADADAGEGSCSADGAPAEGEASFSGK